jgi:hypothetical protein
MSGTFPCRNLKKTLLIKSGGLESRQFSCVPQRVETKMGKQGSNEDHRSGGNQEVGWSKVSLFNKQSR